MPQKISQDIVRVCPGCGKEFHPTARKQTYCGKEVVRYCVVCKSPFTVKCTARNNNKQTCSRKCANILASRSRESLYTNQTRICKWCGKEFHPKSVRQLYCDDIHYNKCVVCGKEFVVNPAIHDITQTCSPECRYTLAVQNRDIETEKEHLKATLESKYGVSNIMDLEDVKAKIIKTNRERYGADHYTQTAEYKEKSKITDQAKYGVDHHLQSPAVKAKRAETNLVKYGATNVFASEYGKFRVKSQMVAKYGVVNPSQLKEFKAKATRSARTSKLEYRICQILDNYNIPYIQHYFLSNDEMSHEFDFYIPKYKLLLDADGLYFHGYLDDPDGVRVLDYYDNVRLSLIPEDHIFHVLVETSEERQLKELFSILDSVNGDITQYRSYLFDWCRSIEFPYPDYTEKRLRKDWLHLQQYHSDKYNCKCRIGESLIKQYHKSIYKCRVYQKCSPWDGWHDDEKLKKVIRNRLIYKNDVDPSKILSGFNISKICPCVSIFNPILAKHLIETYLSEFDTIFDPFSGFSGRLLGAASLGKNYIGSDLNSNVVEESNSIIDFLGFDKQKYSVVQADILQQTGKYECLLTCPPYGKKEYYNSEIVFKSCDGWISECLQRFDCKRYVFVVDVTTEYQDHVVGKIASASHFASIEEVIIVIDK